MYSVVPVLGCGRIWNTVCGSDDAAAPPAAPPASGATQRAKPFVKSGVRPMPMSPHVRAARVSPRRTASGPSVVPTNFAIEPSGPNTCAISPAPASTFALAANGYFVASEFWNGW